MPDTGLKPVMPGSSLFIFYGIHLFHTCDDVATAHNRRANLMVDIE